MSIKDDELYPIYVSYLENRKLNPGSYKLAKISNSMFNEFVHRYEENPDFRDKQDSIYKSIKRDSVIEEILEEFEIILDEPNISTSRAHVDGDDFFDF